jgi:hypothetical protein
MSVFRWVLKILLRIVTFVLLLLVLLFIAFNWPLSDKNEEMGFHVSFSQTFARDLELDWKEVYIAMLDELNPQKIRLAAYWTEIEKTAGVYDFSELDWMIGEATKRNVKMILAFGIKSPRWPECYIPEFYLEDKGARENALLAYEKVLVERYMDNENIIIWQVENEPFLPFGHCIEGAIDANLVDEELEQVRKIDPKRKVMVTDSGELSFWVQAAARSDIFGTTLYRIIHKEPFGYVKYPLGPSFFRIKGWLVRTFVDQENIIISELQAEPWGPDWIGAMTVEEQYKSMNSSKFEEIIIYAQQTKFSESYLWGVEWWYWLKTKKQEFAMWDMANKVITKRQ